MADEVTAAPTPAPTPAWDARRLLRSARAGTLATAAGGQPFASLVTPACGPDLSVLLLLSGLSEHTRHLRAEARCSVLVTGEPTSRNPQTTARLTITGLAAPEPDPALKARWLAMHPYAALYADFADFTLWRIRPAAALFVAGFATATRLKAADLLPDSGHAATVAAAEAGIIAHCNDDHADALAVLGATHGAAGPWHMVAADLDGCDLALDDRVVRFAWRTPVADAGGVRSELVRLVQAARQG
jgi:putative heme iron utilization protein